MTFGKTLILSSVAGTFAAVSVAWAATAPFTKQQAEAGHPIFNTLCAQCHRPDLTGALGPNLINDQFKQKWGGKPIADLRDWINQNMPANAPHSIKPEQLDPIVAWILSKNGLQPGDKALSAQTASAQFPK